MGGDVALKIGHQCSLPSRLTHKYNVYTTVTGSKGISQVLWYGKEGVYEVIVLDHLRTSLGNLINQLKFDHGKSFSYPPKWYVYYIKLPFLATTTSAAKFSPTNMLASIVISLHLLIL